MTEPRSSRRPGRIGPWRLVDIISAGAPMRGSMMGGALLPRVGPPDAPSRTSDPDHELPDSNIGESERSNAVQAERARREQRLRAGSERR